MKAGNSYRWVLSTLAVLMLGLTAVSPADAGISGREADPVVLTGAQTPALVGISPDEVVAFRWFGSWKQIPVQVDERKIADYRVIRQDMGHAEFRAEVYTDPGTWTGADGVPQMTVGSPSTPVAGTTGDANLDQDDEIALMSKDAGISAAGKPNPAGVDGSSRTPVRIKDPLATGGVGYVYLFEKTADLDPSAGTEYVSYDWTFDPALVPGYLAEPGIPGPGYDFGSFAEDELSSGPPKNPEASVISTDFYEQTFPGRWMVDGLRIKAGSATGVDILDGDKTTVGPAGCGRNELTFSRGGGGFIAAVNGPVRAIRSYIGANSGTYTQRDQIYYQGQVRTITYMRVHPHIDGVISAMDYSEEAKGMTYRDSLNPAGVKIDGVPDNAFSFGRMSWEQVSGPQGSIAVIPRVDTDIEPVTVSSYYQDDEDPGNSSMLCSGDDHAYGASGPMIIGLGPFNTDPTIKTIDGQPIATSHLTSDRTTYIDPPSAPKELAIRHSQQVDSPLVISTGAGTEPTGPVEEPDPGPHGQPGRTNWVGLKVSVKPARVKAGIGERKVFRVRVRNVGDLPGKRIRVCPRASDRLVRTGDCQRLKKLRPGKAADFRFSATLRRGAAGKPKVRVRFRAKASKSKPRGSTGLLIPKS